MAQNLLVALLNSQNRCLLCQRQAHFDPQLPKQCHNHQLNAAYCLKSMLLVGRSCSQHLCVLERTSRSLVKGIPFDTCLSQYAIGRGLQTERLYNQLLSSVKFSCDELVDEVVSTPLSCSCCSIIKVYFFQGKERSERRGL